MKMSRQSVCRAPLVAGIALALGGVDAVAAPTPTAVVVQNCLDSGAGSLRQAVIDDISSEPIDLTQLTCSRITLTSGAINVQRALLITGPGAAIFTIDGAGLDRVFVQTSSQPLALYGMAIENGYATSFGGGCVYSAGALQLNDTIIQNCRASDVAGTSTLYGGGVLVRDTLFATRSSIRNNEVYSALGRAVGGGAAVDASAVLDRSAVSGNVASSASNSGARGGGLYIGGPLLLTESTVADNRASGLPGATVIVGGLSANAGTTISQSTISGNSADLGFGGLLLRGSAGSLPSAIIESTISGNSAEVTAGGYAVGHISIRNSTIAFNVAAGIGYGAGLRVGGDPTDIESSIIALNVSYGGTTEQDVGLGPSGSITGSHNLIGPSSGVTLPPDTIGGDPRLLPLHDNGGWTKTHALRAGSPAENAGADNGDDTDQRGAGYPRVLGPSADIGAFEGVDADTIFYDGFD